MGWAAHYIQALERGEIVSFRPRGQSMNPRIRSGQLVTVARLENLRKDALKTVLRELEGKAGE
jgi:hypothetical protein